MLSVSTIGVRFFHWGNLRYGNLRDDKSLVGKKHGSVKMMLRNHMFAYMYKFLQNNIHLLYVSFFDIVVGGPRVSHICFVKFGIAG